MMIDKLVLRAGAIVLMLLGGNAYGGTVTVATVGSLDPNAVANGGALAINDAVSNTAAGGVTLANFTTLVAGKFATDGGGVVNGNSAQGFANGANVGNGPANAIHAKYGTSQTKTLDIWRSDVDAGNSVGDGSGFFAVQTNNNNGANVASVDGYIGFQGVQSPTLAFGSGLLDLGITLLPRGAARSAQLTVGLSNSTTIVSSLESVVAANTNGVFFGFAAPAGLKIVSLAIADTGGFNRYDDLAFVVPEPASMTLFGLGSFGLFVIRRRC
jgi:hypothetical protein